MTKTYQAPMAEIVEFQTEDVLGASIVDPGKGDAPAVDVIVPLF